MLALRTQVDYILQLEDGIAVKIPDELPLSPFSDTLLETLTDMWQFEFERRASCAADTLVTALAPDTMGGHGTSLPPLPNNALDDEFDHDFTVAVRETFLSKFVEMFANMNT